MGSRPIIEQQLHGYVRGHELLATSVRLAPADQDEVNRLSDLSGNLIVGDAPPYLTAYPLPSSKWYAIAVTSPDPKATRRGCVLTRTALIRMEDWRGELSTHSVIEALRPVDRDTTQVSQLTLDSSPADLRPLAPSLDLRLPDFIRYAVGGGKLPIVWPIDNVDQADVWRFAGRYLEVLWPAQRAATSLCTYSLQPRQVDGKTFDLMFVPIEAVSRFRSAPTYILGQSVETKKRTSRSDYIVRMMTRLMNGRTDGDTWSSYAALRQILPAENDALLRLVTLDDLRKRNTDVKSQLAALDVWSSLTPHADQAVTSKRETAEDALAATEALETPAALDALGALQGRLERPALGSLAAMRSDVGTRVAARAARDVRSTLLWFSEGGPLRDALLEEVARGVGRASGAELQWLQVLPADSVLLSTLLRQSPDISARFLSELSVEGAPLRAKTVEGWIDSLDEDGRKQAISRLVRSPYCLLSSGLARACVSAASQDDVTAILSSAHDALSLVDWASLDRLASAFPDSVRLHYLSAGKLHPQETRLLAQTLNDKNIDAALEAMSRHGARGLGELAIEYVRVRPRRPQSPFIGIAAPSDRPVFRALLQSYRAGLIEAAPYLAELAANVTGGELVADLRPGDLKADRSGKIAQAALPRVLASLCGGFLLGRNDGQLLWAWMDEARDLNEQRLVERTVEEQIEKAAGNAGAERVWSLTEHELAITHPDPRTYLSRVQRALSATREQHTEATVEIWTRLIGNAVRMSRGHREVVAIGSFEVALRNPRAPVSPVIIVTFPVLYAGLAGKRTSTIFLGLWPLPFEIDRRKDARRELINTFLKSNWRPGDLALAAHHAGALDRIIGRLRETDHENYIAGMVRDLESRRSHDTALLRRVAEEIRQLRIDHDD